MATPDQNAPPTLPERVSFGALFLGGLIRANSILGVLGTAILAVVMWAYLPGTTVSIVWVTVVVAAGVIVLVVFANMILALRAENVGLTRFMTEERARLLEARSRRSPLQVDRAVAPFHPFVGSSCVLFVKDCPAAADLAIGQHVTILLATETHEVHLGTGQVRPRQTDGDTVITLDVIFPGAAEAVAALTGSDAKDKISRLRIGAVYDLQGAGVKSSQSGQPTLPTAGTT